MCLDHRQCLRPPHGCESPLAVDRRIKAARHPAQTAPSSTALTTGNEADAVRSLSMRSRRFVNSLSALPVRKTQPPWSPRLHGQPARRWGVRSMPEANQRLLAFARAVTRPVFERFACPCHHTALIARRCFKGRLPAVAFQGVECSAARSGDRERGSWACKLRRDGRCFTLAQQAGRALPCHCRSRPSGSCLASP